MESNQITWEPAQILPQLSVMLEMQDDLNRVVFPDWVERDLGWHRAIYVEAAEYLEHLTTWKWWKKGTPDFPQANMELVDIWHFGLSWYLSKEHHFAGRDHLVGSLVEQINEAYEDLPYTVDLLTLDNEVRHLEVDNLVAAAGCRRFDIAAFVRLLAYSGMTFDMLYQRYVGKNMLNRFRQDNGYKTGTYVKNWAGEEDNQHLEQILAGLPVDAELPARVYAALGARYQALAQAA